MSDSGHTAEEDVIVEYAFRDTEGVLHTGEQEGVRWTREQAEHAMNEGDSPLRSRVRVSRGVRGPWCTPGRTPPEYIPGRGWVSQSYGV